MLSSKTKFEVSASAWIIVILPYLKEKRNLPLVMVHFALHSDHLHRILEKEGSYRMCEARNMKNRN